VSDVAVQGLCEPGFERVREALAETLASGSEVGAALAVYVGKRAVIDLWAGHADAARTRPWTRDTIVNLFSVGKAVGAICALRLVEAGLLDLDAPVAHYWPEFAQEGKGRIRVRHLLTHQAALPAVARRLPPGAWSRWEVMTEALAAQAPWWEPGQGHGYHVNTQGFLIGEVVRRITGKTLGAYLRESLAGPAGIDFFIGFGPELDDRCAELSPQAASPEGEELRRQLSVDPGSLSGLTLMRVNAYRNPPEISGTGVVNTRQWRASEVPSTNGHGNARAVARLYSALAGNGDVDGVHVLSPDMIARATRDPVEGSDIVLRHESGAGRMAAQARPPSHRPGLRRAALKPGVALRSVSAAGPARPACAGRRRAP
jgi:CubicO group peptidase (beta-lactamase class C family)